MWQMALFHPHNDMLKTIALDSNHPFSKELVNVGANDAISATVHAKLLGAKLMSSTSRVETRY